MNVAQHIPLADTWGMHGDIGAGWWIVMVVAMVLFWGAIVLGAAWLIRRTADGWPTRQQTPTEILDRRLAEGAISLEEYRERGAALTTEGWPGAEPRADSDQSTAPPTRSESAP